MQISNFVGKRHSAVDHWEFTYTWELCNFVAAEIRNSGRTYKDIASKAGCCQSTVSKMAGCETRFPRVATVFEILRTLGFTVTVRR